MSTMMKMSITTSMTITAMAIGSCVLAADVPPPADVVV